MKLYLLKQEENLGYEVYDSCIVCAENEEEAKKICPSPCYQYNEATKTFHWWIDKGTPEQKYDADTLCDCWATKLDNIEIIYIGEASPTMEKGVVLASYNAG